MTLKLAFSLILLGFSASAQEAPKAMLTGADLWEACNSWPYKLGIGHGDTCKAYVAGAFDAYNRFQISRACVAEPIDLDKVANAVTQWLEANPMSRGEPAAYAVQETMAGRWKCPETIPPWPAGYLLHPGAPK